MIKVGDKVRRKHNDFRFEGTVLAEIVSTEGRRLIAVEQNGTGFVQCFYENMLYIDDGFGWVDAAPETRPVASIPPPPPKLELPLEVFVPLKAIPAAGSSRKMVAEKIRTLHLQQRPRDILVTERVKAEVEFHFAGLRSGDIDNLLKPTLDLLKGSLIRDDGQVMQIASRIIEHSPRGDGININLTKYEAEW